MNVLITGASRGIGYELTQILAREERISIYLISRSKDNLFDLCAICQKINPKARLIPIAFDLNRLVDEDLPKEFNAGSIQLLFNNAGYLVRKEFANHSPSDITAIMNTNFLVPALLIQKCLPLMGGDRPSHVVNIGSMGGFQGSVKFPGLSFYSASKAALASLTECLANEYTERNIFFNCLALGAAQTEMLNEAFPGYQAPLSAKEMAEFIADFGLKGYKYFNGKILPVSVSTP